MSAPLDLEAIARSAHPGCFGRPAYYYPVLQSSNDKALELLGRGAAEGTLIVAGEQTRGRGRRERSWASPPELGIYASLILRPRLSPDKLTLIPLALGVGMVRALRQLGLGAIGVKWPNDLQAHGRKLGGILCELRGEGGREGLIAGLGLNVNQTAFDFPEELRETATSLRQETGKEWERTRVLSEVLARCEREYDAVQSGNDEALLHSFEDLCVFRRRDRLRIRCTQRWVEGRFEGLGSAGQLLLDTGEGGPCAFHYGEIAQVREEE
jgi:BirA family transcriptional regulator, biotin operon repressor / biotin---[acetyl-CoA-carboxylase] ligase